MLVYATLGVTDFARAIRFYDAVMGAINVARAPDWDEHYAGWGVPYAHGFSIWICSPFNGEAPTPGNGVMFALRAQNQTQVNEFHAAALAHGGSDEGAPGPRPQYGADFYACYVRDPDGNKLACVVSNLVSPK